MDFSYDSISSKNSIYSSSSEDLNVQLSLKPRRTFSAPDTVYCEPKIRYQREKKIWDKVNKVIINSLVEITIDTIKSEYDVYEYDIKKKRDSLEIDSNDKSEEELNLKPLRHSTSDSPIDKSVTGKLSDNLEEQLYVLYKDPKKEKIGIHLNVGNDVNHLGRENGGKTVILTFNKKAKLRGIINKKDEISSGQFRTAIDVSFKTEKGKESNIVLKQVKAKRISSSYSDYFSIHESNEELENEVKVLNEHKTPGIEEPPKISGMLIKGSNDGESHIPVKFTIVKKLNGEGFHTWKLSLKEKLNSFTLLANAMYKFHKKKITMGDVKTDNVLCNNEKKTLCFNDLGGVWEMSVFKKKNFFYTNATNTFTKGYFCLWEFMELQELKSLKKILSLRKKMDIFALGVIFVETITKDFMYDIDEEGNGGVFKQTYEERKEFIAKRFTDVKFSSTLKNNKGKIFNDLLSLIAHTTHPIKEKRLSLKEIIKKTKAIVKLIDW